MTDEDRAARVEAIRKGMTGYIEPVRFLLGELDLVTAQEEETAKAFEVLMHDMAEERDAAIARAEKTEHERDMLALEVGRERSRAEKAEAERGRARELHQDAQRIIKAALKERDAAIARAEKAEAYARAMVEKAADKSLDGYRELGPKAAKAEGRES